MKLIVFISHIFINASGWVTSDDSFVFMGVSGLATSDPPRPNDSVGIDLTPTHNPAANLRIHTRQITTEMALSMISLLIL